MSVHASSNLVPTTFAGLHIRSCTGMNENNISPSMLNMYILVIATCKSAESLRLSVMIAAAVCYDPYHNGVYKSSFITLLHSGRLVVYYSCVSHSHFVAIPSCGKCV